MGNKVLSNVNWIVRNSYQSMIDRKIAIFDAIHMFQLNFQSDLQETCENFNEN